MGTLRSYQVLLITQSQCFSSRTRSAESRASTETAVARSSRCEAATAFALEAFRAAMPTRSTPGLERRSGTVHWATAPYPPRMRTLIGRPGRRKAGRHLRFSLSAPISDTRFAARITHPPRAETQRTTRGYTAIEVAWLAMYTAKISGAPSPYDCFKKIGKNP